MRREQPSTPRYSICVQDSRLRSISSTLISWACVRTNAHACRVSTAIRRRTRANIVVQLPTRLDLGLYALETDTLSERSRILRAAWALGAVVALPNQCKCRSCRLAGSSLAQPDLFTPLIAWFPLWFAIRPVFPPHVEHYNSSNGYDSKIQRAGAWWAGGDGAAGWTRGGSRIGCADN